MAVTCTVTLTKDQRGEKGKRDMSSWFIQEYYDLAGTETEKKRTLLLNGSAISAVVAGR
jgi:hypothetical protein